MDKIITTLLLEIQRKLIFNFKEVTCNDFIVSYCKNNTLDILFVANYLNGDKEKCYTISFSLNHEFEYEFIISNNGNELIRNNDMDYIIDYIIEEVI